MPVAIFKASSLCRRVANRPEIPPLSIQLLCSQRETVSFDVVNRGQESNNKKEQEKD